MRFALPPSNCASSRTPYPPPSILDGGGLGGRSTIDYMIARSHEVVE